MEQINAKVYDLKDCCRFMDECTLHASAYINKYIVKAAIRTADQCK